jgi:hypothetical protein
VEEILVALTVAEATAVVVEAAAAVEEANELQ